MERVLAEMLRVGRQGIVSFPNIGLLEAPQAPGRRGPRPAPARCWATSWYNTPNVRFLSIADFEDFCREKGITIHQQIALDTEAGRTVQDDPNLNADMAIVVVSR